MKIKDFLYHSAMCLLSSFCKKCDKRIVFISFNGSSYSDNPKAISEKLYEKCKGEFEYFWIFKDSADLSYLPDYVQVGRYNSFKMFYYLCTSRVWVSNFNFPRWFYKSSKQYYVQTWHGDRGFKKIMGDVSYNNKIIFETTNASLMVSGSSFATKNVYRSAFGYDGEVLLEGCPRNDIFFQSREDVIRRIRNRYSLADDVKVIMYAPTFRRKFKNKRQNVDLDLVKIAKILESVTDSKWKIMVRSHMVNSECGLDVVKNDKIIPVTDYPDMNELLLVCDMLISDYSSSVGDFCLTGKAIILYQDDIEEYTADDRTFYFDLNLSPYFRFTDPQSLYRFLEQYNQIDFDKNSKMIYDFYGSKETGHAAESVVEKILDAVNYAE